MPDERPPRRPAGPTKIELLLEARPAHPGRTILFTGWPVMLVIVVAALVVGYLFPILAGLLVVGAPLAVLGAFFIATLKARSIRLTITGEVVRVASGKAGTTCDRYAVDRMILVEGLKRRRVTPRAPALILLDAGGHAIMLLDGLLWSTAVLEQVAALLAPVPLDRQGQETSTGLASKYPGIFPGR